MVLSEYLTVEQVNQFHRDGYLHIPAFLTPDETDTLLARSKQLLEDFNIEDHPLTKFTTSEKGHVGDEYFLQSGDKIRYFLEEDAVDENGKLTREKHKSVNKIGHALHELDPAFRKVTLENDRLKALVRSLKFHQNPVALQSMVITKQTHIGGKVPEHNDSNSQNLSGQTLHPDSIVCFLTGGSKFHIQYTNPPTALGFWIALEKCTPQNGALSFLPGSHNTVPISRRFVRLPGGGTGFEQLVSPEAEAKASEESKGKYLMVECAPGDLVLIHGSVLHKSERNTSPHTRFAYTFHMIESEPYATYDSKNWLQPTPSMPFSHIL